MLKRKSLEPNYNNSEKKTDDIQTYLKSAGKYTV